MEAVTVGSVVTLVVVVAVIYYGMRYFQKKADATPKPTPKAPLGDGPKGRKREERDDNGSHIP